MVTIHLALSELAATELKGYIDRGGAPVRAIDGHPHVIDDILAELNSQLNAAARGETKTTTTVPIEVGSADEAAAIARKMAAAGASALKGATAA